MNVAYSAAGASLYQSASSGGAEQPGSSEPGAEPQKPKDDSVDADYEVVDEGKK